MGKIRIHEIAKELGITSKETVAKAIEMGFEVKAPSSGVTLEEAESLANFILTGEKILPSQEEKVEKQEKVKEKETKKDEVKETKKKVPEKAKEEKPKVEEKPKELKPQKKELETTQESEKKVSVEKPEEKQPP